MLRHVVAYMLQAVETDLILTAQPVNDGPSSVTKRDADVLGSAMEGTKAYLS